MRGIHFCQLHCLLLHAHTIFPMRSVDSSSLCSGYGMALVAAAGCGMCVCVERESVEWAGGNASRSMPWRQADRTEMEFLHARALRSNYAKYAELAELQRKLGPARSQKNARYATNAHCGVHARILGVACGVRRGVRGACGMRWWIGHLRLYK